jgi:FAD/FMN-containing dehydrogenase
MPNPPSAILLRDLASLLGPRGFTQAAEDMSPWLSDWRGRYCGAAAALLSPGSTEDVAAIVARCAAAGVALVPQGGNSSMVGGATPLPDGDALLLSLRRMNRIRGLSAEDNAVTAEAGVILANLHEAAATIGRRFPLTLGARGSATVGGLVSTNAGGTQVLRFGPMRALVLGLEAVLPDGSLFSALSPLRKDNRGYDVKQLLIGAEGTIGVVTAATLRLVPAIAARAVAWIGVESPRAALVLLRRLEARIGDALESFELVPANALALVLRHVPGSRAPLDRPQPWNVLVEAVAPAHAADPGEGLGAALAEAIEEGAAADAVVAASEAQAEALWKLRDTISEAERAEGPALKHDISVAVSVMPEFVIVAARAVEARYPGARVIAFGHLGDGNIHFNLQPPPGPDAAAWLAEQGEEASGFVYDQVVAAGGSISAEHGIGQMKAATLARTDPPARLAALHAIKRALDPQGIMNPGKLFPLS